MSPNRRASASATIDELTWSWIVDPFLTMAHVLSEMPRQIYRSRFDSGPAISFLLHFLVLPSKIRVLRAVQRAQQTHGSMLPVIPDGGRLMLFLNSVCVAKGTSL